MSGAGFSVPSPAGPAGGRPTGVSEGGTATGFGKDAGALTTSASPFSGRHAVRFHVTQSKQQGGQSLVEA